MGFWHTGYSEFHEAEGLGNFVPNLLPPQFPCVHCVEVFTTLDDLRKHRSEYHPLRRPLLFLQGRELGAHPVRITRDLIDGDVRVDNCDSAVLNGKDIDIASLPILLGKISSGVCRLTLSGLGVSSEFSLDFCIASKKDLRGIEEQFESTVRGRHLDIYAIDAFIDTTKKSFPSAIGYCDGICAYLYGVLAKEKAPNTSLPYNAYVGKFNKASEGLMVYDRPLARTIRSLIEFHFNHFEEAAHLSGETRAGKASERYATWLQGRAQEIDLETTPNDKFSKLEALLTDWDTEQIIRWSIRPLQELFRCVVDMESFLDRGTTAEYDKVKLHVLLCEIYTALGDVKRARDHAKSLRNLPSLQKWAESMIRAHSEKYNDQH